MIVAKSGYAKHLDKPMAVGSKSLATSVVPVCDCGVTTISELTETPLQFGADRKNEACRTGNLGQTRTETLLRVGTLLPG
jgi:hypothetical protein